MFGATRNTHESSAIPTREDQRVDHGRAVALRVPPPHEQEQPADESRIDGQVDRVAERRELDVGAEELRVAVRVEVAGEEQELADDEEQPGQRAPRGRCRRIPTAIATDEERPSRLISGPLPLSGGNQR